jgi:hypothetical protein
MILAFALDQHAELHQNNTPQVQYTCLQSHTLEELGNQRPPHDEETFTTNRSYSEKQKSENVSDDDVYDQTLATILHETDNSNMYYCSKDSDYDSTRRDSGKYISAKY